MKKLSVLVLLIVVSVAQAQDRMTPELLWQLKRIGEISVSPDHLWIAFTQREYAVERGKSESNIYLVSINGGEAKQLTSKDGTEFNLVWGKDGKTLYYLAPAPTGVSIFGTNVDGTTKELSHVRGDITSFKFSADESMLVFSSDVKTESYSGADKYADLPNSNVRIYEDLMYRHWSDWEDGTRSHLFFAPIVNGTVNGDGTDVLEKEPFDAPMKPFGGAEHYAIAPNGKSFVYVCKKLSGAEFAKSTNSDIYSYDFDTKRTTNLSEGMMGYDVDPAYSTDGTKLAWLSMKTDGYEADKNDIVVLDLATKKTVNLTEKFDLTVAMFVWNTTGDKIYFKSIKEATYQFFEYNFAKAELRQITTGDHDFTSIAFAGDYLVGGRQDMNHPTDIFKADIKKGEQTQLTNVNKEIYARVKTSPVEKRWVTTSDGKKELVWVIYPPDFDKTKKYPALLYCQGGPQSPVSQFFSYRWNFQLMAANGYIVIAPNRRGLPGFGQEWNDAIRSDWGGQPIEDYLSAVDEIKKEPYVDSTRIGAVGASYGGYSVYYLAGVHQDRFKCFISHCGLYNLESWYGSTEELFFANSDIGGSYYGATPPKSYLEFSPHRNADKWNTPMLIFHGEQDFRVPLNQGLEAFQALQVKGIESKLVLFPDENHFVLQPQNALVWHREFYAWLDKHLK